MSEIRRTHDQIYLQEDRYTSVKESFKFISNVLGAEPFASASDILDVGCAAGEFCHFLGQIAPESRIVGIDVMDALLEKARSKVPQANFMSGSVLDETCLEDRFDLVFMNGVHSIFDGVEPWLPNLLNWTRRGGTLVVFGIFNPYPVDVFVKVRRADLSDGDLEPGWNVVSIKTVEKFLSSQDTVSSWRFEKFEIGIDIASNTVDPLRSWTEKMEHGKRLTINGTRIVHDFFALVIQRSSN